MTGTDSLLGLSFTRHGPRLTAHGFSRRGPRLTAFPCHGLRLAARGPLGLADARLCCIICRRGQRQDERSPTPPAALRRSRARRLTFEFQALNLPTCGKNLEVVRIRRSPPPPPRASPLCGFALGPKRLSPTAPVSRVNNRQQFRRRRKPCRDRRRPHLKAATRTPRRAAPRRRLTVQS